MNLTRRELLLAGAAGLISRPAWAQGSDVERFAFFSDTHVSDTANLEACIALAKEIVRDVKPAFVVNGGDVVEVGWKTEYDRYAQVLACLGEAHHIPGNHDVRWAPRGLMLFEERLGRPYRSFDRFGCHFVLLDSTVPLSHYGHYESAQLRWLEADLQRVGREVPVFVFTHHWIGRDSVMVDNENALIALLDPYNVKLVLNAHGHSDLLWTTDAVLCTMNKGLYQGSYEEVAIDRRRSEVTLSRRTTQKPLHVLATVRLEPAREKRPVWALSSPGSSPGEPLWLRSRGVESRWDAGTWSPTLGLVPTAGLPPGHHTLSVRTSPTGRMRAFDVLLPAQEQGMRPLWSRKLSGGVMSHLLLDGQNLLVSAMDGSVWALDKGTGEVLWRAQTGGYCHSSPRASEGRVVVGSADGGVYAVARDTGALLWKAQTGGPVYASAAFAHGMAVIASGDGSVYGLEAATGRLAWKYTMPASPSAFSQSPAATDGERVFIGAWDKHLYAVNAADGSVAWRTACTDKSFAYSPAIGGPAVGLGRVFVPSNDNGLWAIDAATGKVLWRATTAGDKFGYSSPCLVEDRVFIGCLGDNGEARCVSAADGKEIWCAKVGSVIYDSSPAFSDGHAVVGSVDGVLHRIRGTDGEVVARYRLPNGHLLASPAAEPGRVYPASYGDVVLGLGA